MINGILEYFGVSGSEQPRLVSKTLPADDIDRIVEEIKASVALPVMVLHPSSVAPKQRAASWMKVIRMLQTPAFPMAVPLDFKALQETHQLAEELRKELSTSLLIGSLPQIEAFRTHRRDFTRFIERIEAEFKAAEAKESKAWEDVMTLLESPEQAASSATFTNGDVDAFQRTVARRDWLIAHERWLSSEDIAKGARGTLVESNKDQYAYQLRQSGQVLGVRHQRKRLHPACQFREVDGRLEPLPIMRSLLAVLPADDSGWDQALWLFQPTGRLDGARPADVLATRPEDVLDAAKKDFHGDPGI
jgi:hypothetical protein